MSQPWRSDNFRVTFDFRVDPEPDHGFATYYDNRYAEVTRRMVLQHEALRGYDGHLSWLDCPCGRSAWIRKRLEDEQFFPEATMNRNDEPVLSGSEANTELDEWKEIHNDERKVVGDMTNEALQEHMGKLEKLARVTKMRLQAGRLVLMERIEEADAEEREAIRKRDLKYKVKPVLVDTGEKKPRATRQTAEEKLRAQLAKFGLSLDDFGKK